MFRRVVQELRVPVSGVRPPEAPPSVDPAPARRRSHPPQEQTTPSMQCDAAPSTVCPPPGRTERNRRDCRADRYDAVPNCPSRAIGTDASMKEVSMMSNQIHL